MKKIITLLSGALAIFTSCGISASYTSSDGGQRFEDGIYSSSPTRKDKLAEQDSKAGLQELAEQTKASQIYLFGDRKDTVMIPENMAATIRYDRQLGTSVTVAEFDPYDFTYGWYTDRYRWNSYWNLGMWNSVYYRGWYDPWHYGSIHSPWYYGGFHNPWYYAGYYDPWYYGGWYDPWYYGYGWHGWYDPFYGYMHPHYCGWYGGWDPYWGYYPHHHHPIYIKDDNWHGSRHSTGSDRVFTSRVSTRGGIATASRTGRTAAVSTASRAQTSGNTAATRVSSRTSASRVSATTPTRVSSASNTGTIKRATTGAQQNYRRPAATASGHIMPTSGRVDGTTATYRPSGTESYRSSGSSYRSSSSSSSSRSSYSTSSSSRSSYSSGSSYSGGGSRSGGSSYSGGSSRSGGSSSGRR